MLLVDLSRLRLFRIPRGLPRLRGTRPVDGGIGGSGVSTGQLAIASCPANACLMHALVLAGTGLALARSDNDGGWPEPAEAPIAQSVPALPPSGNDSSSPRSDEGRRSRRSSWSSSDLRALMVHCGHCRPCAHHARSKIHQPSRLSLDETICNSLRRKQLKLPGPDGRTQPFQQKALSARKAPRKAEPDFGLDDPGSAAMMWGQMWG